MRSLFSNGKPNLFPLKGEQLERLLFLIPLELIIRELIILNAKVYLHFEPYE